MAFIIQFSSAEGTIIAIWESNASLWKTILNYEINNFIISIVAFYQYSNIAVFNFEYVVYILKNI